MGDRLTRKRGKAAVPPAEPVRERMVPSRLGRTAAEREAALKSRVVGQPEACEEIVHFLQQYETGLAQPGKPIASFLFLGPTGTGKTRTVEALAEVMVNNPLAVVKIDCAEYQHSHEIAKLIGSPPGYLGHRETHALLSQAALDQYHTERVKISFVLFDEIEKASDSLWNLLLGILDKAILTTGDNKKVDFSRSMVFMTSNLGSAELNALIESKRLGFAAPVPEAADGGQAQRAKAAVDAARRKFSAEFYNRIDKTVIFNPLTENDLRGVLELELQDVRQRLAFASIMSENGPTTLGRHFSFSLSQAAEEFVLREGTDKRYNARHLKRSVGRHILRTLSGLVASDQIQIGDHVSIDLDAETSELTFDRESRSFDHSDATVLEFLGDPRAA
jgi:ATP-dependent Clp protease ATP-binding subunit ClpB